MSEESVLKSKVKGLYKAFCQDEWNATTTGVIVAFLTVLIMAWWRPWGAVGAVRNWGDWIMYGLAQLFNTEAGFFGYYDEAPKSILAHSGSVIGIGFVGGAFVSACLGNNFAFRIPPYREMVKAVIAGTLMGIGATMAGGCNVGGFYNALGNLAANGFTMWLGLVLGVVLGLKLLYVEMEHITWGSGGAKTLELPKFLMYLLGIAAIIAIIWGANQFTGNEDSDYINSLSGVIIIATGLGYAMQRGRWCMVQGFREPHMTGDTTMARSVMLSIVLVAIGAAVLKYAVPVRAGGDPVLNPGYYVSATFGFGGIVGGFLFGLGAMFAGGCGTGTLWRVGEGQVKLIMVVPFFAIFSSVFKKWFVEEEISMGSKVFLPDVMGYGWSLFLIIGAMVIWYLVVTWNEDTNKLIVPM